MTEGTTSREERRAIELDVLRDVETAFAALVTGVSTGKVSAPFGMPRFLAKPFLAAAGGIVTGLRKAVEDGEYTLAEVAAERRATGA